jgi:hypothetical protein
MVYTYQIDKSLGKNAFYNRESFSNTNNNAILYLNGKKIDSLAL